MNDLYHSQRTMRQMRKVAMQRGVVAILDVGSSKIAALVLRFDGSARMDEEGEFGSLAGQTGFRVIGAATTRSRGVSFGEITAMGETERAIRTALQAAQTGDLPALKLLYARHQWEPNRTSDQHGSTALHWAAGGGHVDVVRYLIEQHSQSPLHTLSKVYKT